MIGKAEQRIQMKKILFEDINEQELVSFIYELKGEECVVYINVEKDIFNYHDKALFNLNEIKNLKRLYNQLINGKRDKIRWQSENGLYSISLKNDSFTDDLAGTLEISVSNYHCVFGFHFYIYELENVCVEDVESDDIISPSFNQVKFWVVKTAENGNASDFNLHYQDSHFEINKPFWLYDFEQREICNGINEYNSGDKNIDICIDDSFLWLHLRKDNHIKLEMDNMAIPLSSVSCEFQATNAIIQKISQDFIR